VVATGVITVRPLEPDDDGWKERSLASTWGSTVVARLDALVDAMPLDGFVAVDENGERIGLVTFDAQGVDVEVVTLHADLEHRGVGRALMDAVRDHAAAGGAHRLWLITTNDNLRALGFYQRWGLTLVALHHEGVTRARLRKPSIPLVAGNGIPIRHELELELDLRPGTDQ